MIREDEALAKILAATEPLPSADAMLADALGRFAAENLIACVAQPAFDNSSMDGYAVIASSAIENARLKIIGEHAAGIDRGLTVQPGEAVRIFTGAPLPLRADAVVMQEDTERANGVVTIRSAAASGEFIRRAGADLAVGQKIVSAGDRITASTIGLLAAQGIASLQIGGQPTVGIVTTGDEVVPAGQKLKPGQIYESNGAMLAALARRAGAEVRAQKHCADDFQKLCAVLDAQTTNSALIVSGGVSVGEHDHVRAALHEIGAELELWRVAIKPGKPFLFGRKGSCHIFGLPGNPVSSFVTFLVFVRAALLRLMGAGELRLPTTAIRLAGAIENTEERAHYLRGKIRDGAFAVAGRQESHALFGLAGSNALLRAESGARLPANEVVDVVALDALQ
ncbi:MAG: molybdopterin molybdotransferase MoeA [Verrucomicrobiota bacterium]|nr:molybdopterin molybdotransferase MoeA [Verrucomicrobiota bacterium]